MLKLRDDSLDWALTHVLSRGDTDIFPLPFEYEAMREGWSEAKRALTQDLDTWPVRAHRRALVPKSGLGLRPATQLDPFDTIIFAALIYEIGAEFEAVRVPISHSRVFSYRFSPSADGQLYDPEINFESFRIRSLERARDRRVALVVMTDIADYFPRIYSHPMENAMLAASSQPDHARVLTKLITAWNMGVSYGLPVGPSPSRLISEVTVADVDQALLAEGIDFCRFSDDYRLFVSTPRKAREALAFLANVLHRHHGLTLSEGKTAILPSEVFVQRFERAERDEERHELKRRFSSLAKRLKLDSEYGDISYEDLTSSQKAVVDSLNLWSIVKREARVKRTLDLPLTRFILRRIAQLGLRDKNNVLLGNTARFAPVFREVVEALVMQSGLTPMGQKALGEELLGLFDDEAVGYLEYHREWLLTPFVEKAVWNHTARLMKLYERHFDEMTRRAIMLALGRGGVAHWFKTRKPEVFQLSPWNRRSFLYGASCLPGDEAKHWYRSLRPQLDLLDRITVDYAKTHALG